MAMDDEVRTEKEVILKELRASHGKTTKELSVDVEALAHESDRGAVLVGAAHLDTALEALLRTGMAEESKRVDPLFDSPLAPLQSFWAKIQLAHALELINKDQFDALNDIRRLRNEVAHSIAPVQLNESRIKSLLKRFSRRSQIKAHAISQAIEELHGPSGSERNRILFSCAIGFLLGYFEANAELVPRLLVARLVARHKKDHVRP